MFDITNPIYLPWIPSSFSPPNNSTITTTFVGDEGIEKQTEFITKH